MRGFDIDPVLTTNGIFYHDEYLIQQWNKVVSKKDTIYILGDLTMNSDKHYHLLDELYGEKIIVLGNHDIISKKNILKLLKYVKGIGGAVEYKGYMLTHVPIHPMEAVQYRGNIHAHIHHINKIEESIVPQLYQERTQNFSTLHKYINVDAHLLNYQPISMNEIHEKIHT